MRSERTGRKGNKVRRIYSENNGRDPLAKGSEAFVTLIMCWMIPSLPSTAVIVTITVTPF